MSEAKHTRSRLSDHDVERLVGQTPCLCGSVESWHPECYRGKTDAQIKAGYRTVFAKVRRHLMTSFEAEARAAIAKATGSQP